MSEPSPSRKTTATDLAIEGWSSRLAAFVVASLLVEALTGLWIWLAPFSLVAQIQVLLHTAAGLIILVPATRYAWRHWRAWRGQTLTAVMVLGYVLLAFVLISVVSGLLLTWQSAFGLRRSPLWDLIHLVSGIGAFVILCVHVPMAWIRRRAVRTRMPALGLAAKAFARRTTAWTGTTVVALLAVGLLLRQAPATFPVPDDYQLSAYLESRDEYRGNPFAPTYARTANGELVRPEVLSGSASCGTSGCHEQIYKEWLPSAHRFAAMNPPFLQVQKNFAAERGAPETRYCAGCHDPISLFAGAKDMSNIDLAAPGMQEGCSCVVCHSISHADQRGNADYVITPPQKYLWEGTTGVRKFVSDFLIRAYPQQHLDDYDRNLLRTPEFCAACHKQFIPEALNRFGLSPGQNQYDEWRNSHWHVEGSDRDLSCRDCHMRLVDSEDPGAGEGGDVRRSPGDRKHRHHGTIATNVLMPEVLKLEGWQEHVRLTREWIRGDTVLPEIAHLWEKGPVADVDILGPDSIPEGGELKLRVLVTNRKVGHNFSTGPLDFVRAWLHVRIEDADGNRLREWGNIDPKTRRIQDLEGTEHRIGNPRDKGTLVLEARPLDEHGNPIVKHELWKKAGGEGLRVIFPGYSDNQVFKLVVPQGTRGPLQVKVALNFRRYRQEFLDLVVPDMEKDSGVIQPTVQQSSGTKSIRITPSKDAK